MKVLGPADRLAPEIQPGIPDGSRSNAPAWERPSRPRLGPPVRSTRIVFRERSYVGAWEREVINSPDRDHSDRRSTWLDPLNGRVRRFIGRLAPGGDIVLEGLDDDPRERWSFREISPDRFRWVGEASSDGGRTWVVTDEMRARRRA